MEDDFLFASLNGAYQEEDEEQSYVSTRHHGTVEGMASTLSLPDAMLALREHSVAGTNPTLQCAILRQTMGNMALCRGRNGKTLYEAGAADALHTVLESHNTAEGLPEVTLLALGAIRDLACGNADVRSALHKSLPKLYDMLTQVDQSDDDDNETSDILETTSSCKLQLHTAVLSALRNLTHSHRHNCAELHALGLTDYLVQRILHQPPPPPDDPTRQAYFRASGILLNMAEKCDEVVAMVATTGTHVIEHAMAIHQQQVVLHGGLLRLLARECPPNPKYIHILEADAKKRQIDRERENLRKQQKDRDAK